MCLVFHVGVQLLAVSFTELILLEPLSLMCYVLMNVILACTTEFYFLSDEHLQLKMFSV